MGRHLELTRLASPRVHALDLGKVWSQPQRQIPCPTIEIQEQAPLTERLIAGRSQRRADPSLESLVLLVVHLPKAQGRMTGIPGRPGQPFCRDVDFDLARSGQRASFAGQFRQGLIDLFPGNLTARDRDNLVASARVKAHPVSTAPELDAVPVTPWAFCRKLLARERVWGLKAHTSQRMEGTLDLGLPLKVIGQVLPLAAAAPTCARTKYGTPGLNPEGRALKDLQKLALGVALLFFGNPDPHPVARGRTMDKNGPTAGVATHSSPPTGEILDDQLFDEIWCSVHGAPLVACPRI